MMERVNSIMIYLIYCKNFFNATMYPQHISKKINKFFKKECWWCDSVQVQRPDSVILKQRPKICDQRGCWC
jgi:hypothetical protein